MNNNIAAIRRDYSLKALEEDDTAADAFDQFTQWWNEAVSSEIDEVNAMTLATATREGKPSARIVLLKDYDERGFVFFTNYSSDKGIQLEVNPFAALTFFWKELERQIRIEGVVEKIEASESDAYFFTRPLGSRIGAWASPQSKVIENRNILDTNIEQYSTQFGEEVPRPLTWGGYRVRPETIEFWQGRSNRLHDRIKYTKQAAGGWIKERLAP